MSLLECTPVKSIELQKIVRAIPMQILVKNLTKIYKNFKDKEKLNYNMEIFERYAEEIDFQCQEAEKYEMIIESAFNYFILLNYIKDFNESKDGMMMQDDADLELNEFLISLDELQGKSTNLMSNFQLISNFGNLGKSMFKCGFSLLKKVKESTFDLAKNAIFSGEEKDEKQIKEEEQNEKQLQLETLRFFYGKIQHIEIVRDEQIYKIYFPVLPICQKLDKKFKRQFHETVDRQTTVTKIQGLIKKSNYYFLAMRHEERLRLLFERFSLLQLIATQKTIWENLAFIGCILMNLIILFSYSIDEVPPEAYDDDGKIVDTTLFNDYKLNHPQLNLFGSKLSNTDILIYIVAILNLVFSGLVVFFFLLKTAPLLSHRVWATALTQFKSSTVGKTKKVFIFIKSCVKTLIIWLTDFDFLYYCLYILFVVIGMMIHPFFFAFHLSDFLRIGILKNVVQAIYIPRLQLFLTFLMFLLLIYFFTLWAYIMFYDNYIDKDSYSETGVADYWRCEDYLRCFFSTFDFTFKQTGAVGGCITDPVLIDVGDIEYHEKHFEKFILRFIFDNLFIILVLKILLSMVQGVIIDTFAALKDKLFEREEDEEHRCFICGINREKLDKNCGNKNGYFGHIKQDHYMWSYINFIGYIKTKQQTELTGVEQYIFDMIKHDNLNWFPVKRTLNFLEEEEENMDENNESQTKSDNMEEINAEMEKIQNQLDKLIK